MLTEADLAAADRAAVVKSICAVSIGMPMRVATLADRFDVVRLLSRPK
jgi:hypothetical protein